MKLYKTLLFDVDDTLLDFGAVENAADYKRINQGLWKSFEAGKVERDEVVNTRFSILRPRGSSIESI